MTSNASQNEKVTFSSNGDEAAKSGTAFDPAGPSFYNASERDLMRRQRQAGNAIMRDAARLRGYRLHPLLSAGKIVEPT